MVHVYSRGYDNLLFGATVLRNHNVGTLILYVKGQTNQLTSLYTYMYYDQTADLQTQNKCSNSMTSRLQFWLLYFSFNLPSSGSCMVTLATEGSCNIAMTGSVSLNLNQCGPSNTVSSSMCTLQILVC